MMKNRKIRIIRFALMMIFAFALAFGLSSCGLFSSDYGEVSGLRVINTEINDAGELIIYFSDNTYQNAGVIANIENNLTVDGNGENVSGATAKGLMSAVSIQSNFVSRTQSYIPGFGIIGGSGREYYSRGSGVIYRLEGEEALIITNHHVVYDSGSRTSDGISEKIQVFLYGREEENYSIKAEYVGGSQYYDIAVLRCKDSAFTTGAVRAADVFDGAVTVGQTAIAVGNPQGYGISASLGIVSVDSEHIMLSDGVNSSRVIRVDTAVNAGNSGGGLYDGRGELIGIVNAKIVDESVENIGYAIPTSIAIAVADNIIDNCLGKTNKTVKRAMLGIDLSTAAATTVINENGGVEIRETVVISGTERGSLAAGVLQKGDILLSASIGEDKMEITRSYHIIDYMLRARVGDVVNVEIKRGGETLIKSFTVTADAISDY